MSEQPGPSVEDVLHAAVSNVGGEDRPGQVQMAHAVREAMRRHEHLLVQAGTGTGKSLGYLVPAVLHDARVVVATATLALQHQLVQRDIPALLDAAADVLGERPTYAVLKGRSNYACLHRIRDGVPDDQGTLVDLPEGSLGGEVLRLREWAEEESKAGGVGDRDSAPAHTEKVWHQVSVSHRECLGAAKCPYALECFAERGRERAMQSKLIVTNHSLLAIDAIEGVPMIPEYDVVVVDEAHELSARVTQAATDELSVPAIERAARRARNFLDGSQADDMSEAGDALRAAMDDVDSGTDRRACPTVWPMRCRCFEGRQQQRSRRSRRSRRSATPTPPGSRHAAWSTRSARSPSGWSPTASTKSPGSPSGSGSAAATSSAWRPCRSGGSCATGC